MTLAFAKERPPPATTRYTDAVLAEARTRGDPLGDAAMAALIESRRPLRDPAAQARALAEAGEPACAALIHEVDQTPTWLEPERIRAGAELCLRHVIPAGVALLAGSLIESYAGARGAKVLTRTGRLQGDAFKRLNQTMQFVSDIGVHRGAIPGNPAHAQVVGVRLMHALARRRCLSIGDWDSEAWGHPINQEDSLVLITMFSHVFRRSLPLLGLPLSEALHDSLHHSWRLTGTVLGVDVDLLPRSPAEEEELYLAITARQFFPDADSRALTAAVFESMGGAPPLFVPGSALRALSRRLIGGELADALGIPRAPAARAMVSLAAAIKRLDHAGVERIPGYGRLRTELGEELVERIQRAGLEEPTTYAASFSLVDLLRTGALNGVTLGAPREEVMRRLGPPELWSSMGVKTENDAPQEQAQSWIYGLFELWFDAEHRLKTIFSDHLDQPLGGAELPTDTAPLYREQPRAEAVATLRALGFPEPQVETPRETLIYLRYPSDVCVMVSEGDQHPDGAPGFPDGVFGVIYKAPEEPEGA